MQTLLTRAIVHIDLCEKLSRMGLNGLVQTLPQHHHYHSHPIVYLLLLGLVIQC